ncbi:MAG: ABC transporter permease [Burkholderiales bacterium]
MRRRSGRIRRTVKIVLVILFWLAVWQIASMLVNRALYMPSPAETFSALSKIVVTEKFWLDVAFTFYRVVLGIAISFVSGIALAYLASRWSVLETLLGPAITAVKSTPVASVIILALVWFDSSFVPVFSCVLLCFPIFYTNTLSGIKSVDRDLLEMAAVFGVGHKRVLTGISVPSVLPNVYSALSICLGFSWKSVVAAEVLASSKHSMGYNLYTTKLSLETPELFAWTLTIIIISIAVEKGLKRILPRGNRL